MKITEKKLIEIAEKRIDEIKKLEENFTALAAKGMHIADMAEVFAEFIKAFPGEEKTASYVFLFMMGARIGKKMRPLTVYKNAAALKKLKNQGGGQKN